MDFRARVHRLSVCIMAGAFAIMIFSVSTMAAPPPREKPNIVMVITDDQGYGDISAHGHPQLKTPHLDKLHSRSIRFTDYHVDPTCSPTRSALMTGRYSTRTGVWHTIAGRSLMNTKEITLAEVLQANGYATGMFGKWHLGDNYPLRPQDQGFDHVVWHQGGGVGQSPDYWGNDYFDDTYQVNGEYVKFDGYCTDIWADEAIKFFEANRARPFFTYVSTNAPHGPYLVDAKYSAKYEELGASQATAKFFGMIENIDENVGRMRAKLEELGIADNTIFIFTTDNGSARAGVKDKSGFLAFDGGMRGRKGSQYEGGHRVPFFLHYPAVGWVEGRDVDTLCAHIDVLPTLVDLINAEDPAANIRDGRSLIPWMTGKQDQYAERVLFVHSQRIHMPKKWKTSAVMYKRWRLIEGERLYDLADDPRQQNDIATDHPEMVEKLRGEYEAWWKSLEPVFDDVVRIEVGGPENPTALSSHDWFVKQGNTPWHQNAVRGGAIRNGPWMLNVLKPGKYKIELIRIPGQAMQCVNAKIEIAGEVKEQQVDVNDASAAFMVELPVGEVSLTTTLTREDGKEHGAYYANVTFVSESN